MLSCIVSFLKYLWYYALRHSLPVVFDVTLWTLYEGFYALMVSFYCVNVVLSVAVTVLSKCPPLTDGERVANTTLIDALLDKDFKLIINDAVYNVCSPEKGTKTFLFGHKYSSFYFLCNHKIGLLIEKQ